MEAGLGQHLNFISTRSGRPHFQDSLQILHLSRASFGVVMSFPSRFLTRQGFWQLLWDAFLGLHKSVQLLASAVVLSSEAAFPGAAHAEC